MTREDKLILLKAIDDALDFQQQKAIKDTENEVNEIRSNPAQREAITITYTELAKRRFFASVEYRKMREKLLNDVGAE